MAEKLGHPSFSPWHRVISLYLKSIEKVGQYYKGFIDGEDNYKSFIDSFSAVSSNSFCVRTSAKRKNDHSEAQVNVTLENNEQEDQEGQRDEDQGNAKEEGTAGRALQRRLNHTEGKLSIFCWPSNAPLGINTL